MNAQIIAVANQKGGVGKTTTCANLGIGLVQAGKKVLLVDADPQASLTISLGNPQSDKLPFTLSDAMGRILMDEPIKPGEGILHHPEGVDLIPADIQLSGMEVSLVNAMSRETVLRQYRGEIVLAYQTSGSHERALDYYGPELFPQRGCCIYQKTVQSHSTQVDAACIRELWLLDDGRFVEVSGVTTKYRSAYERFSTCYRTVHHIVKGRDWQGYPPEEIADAFEDINDHPFDGMPGVFYEV